MSGRELEVRGPRRGLWAHDARDRVATPLSVPRRDTGVWTVESVQRPAGEQVHRIHNILIGTTLI